MLVYHDADRLRSPCAISGAPIVHLLASTSGTDSDWVVKLIDVYPDELPSQPEMGGYELAISMDIFRGRYRESFERPAADCREPGRAVHVRAADGQSRLQAGHRIMVQVQSTLFPLYDRNPADVRAEHLSCEAVGLREGHAARLPRDAGGELHRSAGRHGRAGNPDALRTGATVLTLDRTGQMPRSHRPVSAGSHRPEAANAPDCVRRIAPTENKRSHRPEATIAPTCVS